MESNIYCPYNVITNQLHAATSYCKVIERLGQIRDGDRSCPRQINLAYQENGRVIFGRLWGLWKDLKLSKTLRPHIFRETAVV
jgi:hypothetical protein